MLVKICGIQTREAALAVQEAQADFIGFVFATSKRQVTPEKAANITQYLSPSLKKVGVFVNESIQNIIDIARHVGLDMIQLHGDESPAFRRGLPYPVIKAFPATTDSIQKIPDFPCEFYLLDSPQGKKRGGTGNVFDWHLLDGLDINRRQLVLAGGLSPTNVNKAISIVRPAMVDVSSGVETNGVKDPTKINEFIKQAKEKVDD